jgi:hypothetical protein
VTHTDQDRSDRGHADTADADDVYPRWRVESNRRDLRH